MQEVSLASSDARRGTLGGALDRFFAAAATKFSVVTGQPMAFIIASATIIAWIVTGPLFAWSDTWQLVVNTATTIITFLMVFLIQNSQNRDAAAMQAKLDELIRAVEAARNEFVGIEHLTDRQIEAIRFKLEEEIASHGRGRHATASIDRLLDRR